ncbi:hypothetical protein GXW83_27370 [Streptacidiphilus sp. PB12-B1b]|nr:hypothetical protein [Streptacidiphilus sp. PB12-B1b]QMU78867.1 hypothetical protein GXW83_27370 [Streptacidiphilus sp. PB12-B1b]
MIFLIVATPAEADVVLHRLRDAFSTADPIGIPDPDDIEGQVALSVDVHL